MGIALKVSDRFVGTAQLHGERFCSAEKIAMGVGQCGCSSEVAGSVGAFEIEADAVRLVELHEDVGLQGAVGRLWREVADGRIVYRSECVEILIRISGGAIAVKAVEQDEAVAGIDKAVDLLSAIGEEVYAAIESAVGGLPVFDIFVEVDASDAVGAIGHGAVGIRWQTEVEGEVDTCRVGGCVGRVAHKFIVDVGKALVLQELYDTVAFGIEHGQVKRHSAIEQRAAAVGAHNRGNGVAVVEMTEGLYIGAPTGLHPIDQVGALPLVLHLGVDGGLKVAFGAKGADERGLRVTHQCVVVDHRGFADAVHNAVEEQAVVGAREAVDAQRHFDGAEPSEIGLLADVGAIVGRIDLRCIALETNA